MNNLIPTRANRVYISNVSKFGYDNVRPFGEPYFLSIGFIKLSDPNSILKELGPKIQESAATDYVLLVGNNILCSMVFMAWMKKHKMINLLLFNPKLKGGEGDYETVTIVDTEWSEPDAKQGTQGS